MNLVRVKDSKNLQWRIPLQSLAQQLDGMGDFPFRDPDQARFEKPTLIIRGTKSPYVADESLPIIGRFFPKFELVSIEAGHWVISEKPEEFRKGMMESLEIIFHTNVILAVVEFLQDKE
jgi:pimeloyl-ACP methyl ester carboxylesterase